MNRIDYAAFTDTIREAISAEQLGKDFGIPIGRGGRCPCVFCSGDRQDTLKLYPGDRGFYCFDAGDDFRCSDHPKGLEPHWTREQINRPNRCPHFALSDLGDAETGRTYHPREEHAEKGNQGQLCAYDFW